MSLFNSLATKQIADHEIQIFFRIDGVDITSGPDTRLLSMASGPGIPVDQQKALSGRYAGNTIWKREQSSGTGQDFHRHIRDVVGGKREDLATRWTLDDTASRFVGSADLYDQDVDRGGRIKKRMILSFNDAAQKRLAAHAISSSGLTVTCRDLTLTLFKTGHGFAVTTLELSRLDLAPITAMELLEGQIMIVRFGAIIWGATADGIGTAYSAPFRLAELVQRLVVGERADTLPERVTTFTYAQFSEALPTLERDLFAIHLARHYTSDYVTAAEIGGVSFVRDFDTVRHTVALEGAATVVGMPPEAPYRPEFLRDFKTGTFHRHYVPVALLVQHEHAFLVRRTSAAVLTQGEMRDARQTVRRLQELRESCLLFRLCYRFSELSAVTMHNSLNRAFRKVLNLDRMTKELDSDVETFEAHLRQLHQSEERRREKDKHRRYYWVTVIGAGALAGLTMFSITNEFLGIFIHEVPANGVEQFVKILNHEIPQAMVPKLAGLGLGILTAIFGWIIAYLRGPKAGHTEHKTMHLMLEHMIEEHVSGKK
jgi:hypothetical protein